jgi:hypothetical protein
MEAENPKLSQTSLGGNEAALMGDFARSGFSKKHCPQQLLLWALELQSIAQQLLLWASVSASNFRKKTNGIWGNWDSLLPYH